VTEVPPAMPKVTAWAPAKAALKRFLGYMFG
jgi:hypothetical protein